MRFLAAVLALAPLAACQPPNDVIAGSRVLDRDLITVLDGDTIRVGDEVVRIAGVDAAELPPWSECWAEAALADRSKKAAEGLLEGNLGRQGWRITNQRGRNARGYLIASLTRDDGQDFAEEMNVHGQVAIADDWDWCGPPENLRDDNGPNLWFPTDDRHEPAHD